MFQTFGTGVDGIAKQAILVCGSTENIVGIGTVIVTFQNASHKYPVNYSRIPGGEFQKSQTTVGSGQDFEPFSQQPLLLKNWSNRIKLSFNKPDAQP